MSNVRKHQDPILAPLKAKFLDITVYDHSSSLYSLIISFSHHPILSVTQQYNLCLHYVTLTELTWIAQTIPLPEPLDVY